MALAKKSALLCMALLVSSSAFGAGGSAVSPYAYQITEVFGLPITNAMVTTWAISLLLIVVVRLMVRRPKLVPGRGQTIVETMVLGVRDLMAPIVGQKAIKHVFPLLISFFLFILIMNWSGLFPGVGSFGHFQPVDAVAAEQVAELKAHGQIVREIDGQFYTGYFKYFFRPANSDMNTTLALGIISFIAWLWFVLKLAGLKALGFDLFGNKADKNEVATGIYLLLFPIFFMVGFVEVVSILSRLVSLPFRLFGNVFGGENLLAGMHNLVSNDGFFGWLLTFWIPVPFFLLELLIGLVQALVFTLLTAVYIGLITNHEEDH